MFIVVDIYKTIISRMYKFSVYFTYISKQNLSFEANQNCTSLVYFIRYYHSYENTQKKERKKSKLSITLKIK